MEGKRWALDHAPLRLFLRLDAAVGTDAGVTGSVQKTKMRPSAEARRCRDRLSASPREPSPSVKRFMAGERVRKDQGASDEPGFSAQSFGGHREGRHHKSLCPPKLGAEPSGSWRVSLARRPCSPAMNSPRTRHKNLWQKHELFSKPREPR